MLLGEAFHDEIFKYNYIITLSLVFFFLPPDFLSSLESLSKEGGCSADLKPKVNTKTAATIARATGIYSFQSKSCHG
nr:unnamed protein product [Callosobruchus chinensis]